jgi:DNA-binding transcriptional LysR family regulator
MRLQSGNLFSFEAKRGGESGIDTLITGQRLNVERIASMVRQAAVAGLGIAFLFDLIAKRDIEAGRLVPVLDQLGANARQ